MNCLNFLSILAIFMNFVVISVDIVDNFVDIYMLSAIICAE